MFKIFSVYDSKVGAFMNPLFLRSRGEAIRMFDNTVNSGDSFLSKNPEDFTLFELGDWDELSSKFVIHPTPVSVGLAIEFIKSTKFEVSSQTGNITPISATV